MQRSSDAAKGRRGRHRAIAQATSGMRLPLWATLGLLAAACGTQSQPETGAQSVLVKPPAVPEQGAPSSVTSEDTIGTARMKQDGTVVLQLRAAGDGMQGDAQFEYPPDHADYQYVLDHLGGLKPGEEKLVRPFPDP
ncbi:MAG: hypothetical protein OXU20_27710 [Myxococcales bacterium]|nr:hypothetical protein [Myxococcales bacterium]